MQLHDPADAQTPLGQNQQLIYLPMCSRPQLRNTFRQFLECLWLLAELKLVDDQIFFDHQVVYVQPR